MRRSLRVGIPLAVATAVVAALVMAQPWHEGPGSLVQEAAGQVQDYSFCDVSVHVPPGFIAYATERPSPQGRLTKVLMVEAERPKGEAGVVESVTGPPDKLPSSVVIDPKTGAVLGEHYQTSGDEQRIGQVLAGLRVGPLDASVPAWPVTDTRPQAQEKIKVSKVQYRPPDSRAGMLVSYLFASSNVLLVSTCDSEVSIDVDSGALMKSKITATDKPAFDRFLGQVDGLR